QQCVWADEERRSARSAEESAGGSQEDAVTLLQPRPGNLAAKNGEFVSQHDNLQLLEVARAQPQRRHRKRPPKQQLQQCHDQEEPPLARVRKRRTLRCDSTPRRSSVTGRICAPNTPAGAKGWLRVSIRQIASVRRRAISTEARAEPRRRP